MDFKLHKKCFEVWKNHQFILLLTFFHIIFIILIAIFGRYPEYKVNDNNLSKMSTIYPMFADINVMIFIGFGFLMTFLKRYGYSAVSINMLLATFSIIWSIIIRGFLNETFSSNKYFILSITNLIYSNFSAGVVLISMGVLLGKLSPTQYLIMALCEIPVAMILEHVITEILFVADIGGSLVIHIIGCFFGLGVSKIINRREIYKSNNESSVYHSDLFSIIGTLALWIFWPSFNGALADGDIGKERSVSNTFLSLVGATIATFLTSNLISKKKEFNMVHIGNSTLAGGVGIGNVANVVTNPWVSLVVGTISGFISVLGYEFVTPILSKKGILHDTCGVINLHGFPGIISGICGIIFAFIYTKNYYVNDEYYMIFPETKNGRTSSQQALYQFIGLVIALFGSLIGGILTGIILRLPVWDKVPDDDLFSDSKYFHTPDDYEFTTKISSNIKTLKNKKLDLENI
ncbi:Rh30-like protein [Strongyloides ratti]|uniref:Rh30-like protein n=1 Tax=Strongyloides ratti TaxID=34506 RepID=A0A090KQK7_STRRB|nr:Rh30-like protein [Strongyloides ratti]CEF59659.1 Rh30-like protein [Strongyloides ratti]